MEGPPGNSARRAQLLLCGEKKLPGGDSGSGGGCTRAGCVSMRRRRGRWSFWAEGWAPVVRAGLGSWAVRRKEARGGLGRAGLGLLGFGVGSLLLFLFQTTLNLFEFKFKFEFNPNTQPK